MPTLVYVPGSGEYPECPFELGDRVRLKAEYLGPGVDPAHWTGTVAQVPDSSREIVALGPHKLGAEMAVDLDGGGRGVGHYERWEAI